MFFSSPRLWTVESIWVLTQKEVSVFIRVRDGGKSCEYLHIHYFSFSTHLEAIFISCIRIFSPGKSKPCESRLEVSSFFPPLSLTVSDWHCDLNPCHLFLVILHGTSLKNLVPFPLCFGISVPDNSNWPFSFSGTSAASEAGKANIYRETQEGP